MGVMRFLVRRPVEPAPCVLLLPSPSAAVPRGDGEGAMSTRAVVPSCLCAQRTVPPGATPLFDADHLSNVYALEAIMSQPAATPDASGARKRRPAPHRRALRRAGRRHGRLVTEAISAPPRGVRSAIAVTCAKDRRCHRVTDEALAVARATPGGRPPALCGHPVLATALVCPPGPDCQGCAAAATPRRTDRGRHRRRTRGRHRHRTW